MIMVLEQKEKSEQLREKMIAEVTDFSIVLLDVNGTILTWNSGAEKIKGYAKDEIIGQNFRIFYLPSDRQAGLPEHLIALAIKEGRASHVGRRVRKDGSVFWGSINITALHDDDGIVIGFTKFTRELDDNHLH